MSATSWVTSGMDSTFALVGLGGHAFRFDLAGEISSLLNPW